MGCDVQRDRVELNLLCLDFDEHVRHGILLVVFVAREQFDGHLLGLFRKAENNQRAQHQCRNGARQVRAVVQHSRATRVAPQIRGLIAHLGAHHEHAELDVLLGLGHVNVDGDSVRLTDHQQLLLPREQYMRLRESAWTNCAIARSTNAKLPWSVRMRSTSLL